MDSLDSKPVTCTLWVHDESFSTAHALFNAAAVTNAGFAVGSLLRVRSNAEERKKHLTRSRPISEPRASVQDDPFVFILRDVDAELKAKNPKMQLSVSQRVAELYHLGKNTTVQVVEASKTAHVATHVEITFKDVYLTRADMHRMTSSVFLNNALLSGEVASYLGSVRLTVRSIYRNETRLRCGVLTPSTKPVFRSESARFIIYIQMSKEMWDFDAHGTGEISFSTVVNGLLPQLFKKWSRMHARHLVSIVFFTRIDYHHGNENVKGPTNAQGMERAYQDFYRVVVGETSSGEWTSILQQLSEEFKTFLGEILMYKGTTKLKMDEPQDLVIADQEFALMSGRPSPARNGNILEAINTASSPFSKDWIDTDLFRTGLSIVIITPSAGVFEVEESMLHLTTENLVNNGINIDLICVSPPPLHAVPLFRFQPRNSHMYPDKSMAKSSLPSIDASTLARQDASIDSRTRNEQRKIVSEAAINESHHWACAVPQWMHAHFWQGFAGGKTVSQKSARLEHRQMSICSMHDVRMDGIMESEMRDINTPYMNLGSEIHDSGQNETCRELDTSIQGSALFRARSRSTLVDKSPQSSDYDAVKMLKSSQSYDSDMFGPRHSVEEQMHHVDIPRASRLTRKSTPGSIFQEEHSGITPDNSLARSSLLRRLSPRLQSPDRSRRTSSVGVEYGGSSGTHLQSTSLNRRLQRSDRQQANALLATSHGLTFGKAAPSTMTQQSSAQLFHTPALSALSMVADSSNARSTPTVSQQVRSSLSRQAAGPTLSRTSSISSRTVSVRATPQDVPKAVRPTIFQKPEFVETGDPEWNVSSVTRKSSVRVGDDFNKSDQQISSRFPLQLSPSLAPWLSIVNPARLRENHIDDHGWAHAFVQTAQTRPWKMKWESLCSPAALPLTSDYLVSPQILAGLVERQHRITLDGDDSSLSLGSTRVGLMLELISFRLAKGFQIVRSSDASLVSPFDHDTLAKDGCSIYLMKGNAIHVICSAGTDIQITRYQPEMATPEHDALEKPYIALIKSTLEPSYETIAASLTLARDTWNWSIIDNYLAGHIENFPEATGYWRTRFVLIPIQPGRYARRAFRAPNDDTDDELRIEGIQRLTQIWHRARVREEDGQSVSDLRWRKEVDSNPLGLEFQTRDASAVLSAGLEDSRLFQGQSFVVSTQLFSDGDGYRTSNFDLKELAMALQGEKGIETKDRRWYLSTHRHSFVGSDLTSWLHQQFQDISTREEAETFGRKLMDMGLFKHVRGAHKLRDGNFFYTFAEDYRVTNSNVPDTSTQKGGTASTPIIPSQEKKVSTTGSAARTQPRESSDIAPSPVQKTITGVKKPRVNLTAVIRCDLDPRRKSDRDETVKLHYDRLFNPETCYHFRLEWMSTTAKLVEEAVSAWSTMAERHGLKLVEAPIAEACRVADMNPFRTPSFTTLAVAPPEAEPELSHVDSSAPEPLPTHRYHPYQRALLKRFGFVLDQEAGVNFPSDVDVRYSFAHVDYTYSQYIHKTGVILAQVDIEGRLMLVANRLVNNRAGFYRDVATKRDEEKAQQAGFSESRPGTGMLSRSQVLSSPSANPTSPGKSSASSDPGHRERLAQAPIVTAEQLKEEIESFCTNKEALTAFYEEVSRRDPILSPRSTPAFGPRQPHSSRSTPLLQAIIPTLELPPLFGIGHMLSNASTPSAGVPGHSPSFEKHERSDS